MLSVVFYEDNRKRCGTALGSQDVTLALPRAMREFLFLRCMTDPSEGMWEDVLAELLPSFAIYMLFRRQTRRSGDGTFN